MRFLLCFVLLGVMMPSSMSFARDDIPSEGRFAEINGMKMYYEVHGEGEPLLLLHYYGGSGKIWRPYLENLAKQYRVIIPDLRHHGRTNNPTGKFTHRQSALDVYALLDEIEVERVRAMGVSTGGMTLIHMATSQPERIDAMVLIAATHFFPEQCREVQRARTFESIPPEDLPRLREHHPRGDEQIREILAMFRTMGDTYDDMNFTPPYLSTIKARTLIVHGDRDRLFPVSIAVEIYESIPNSYLWIIPNGGHVSFFRERAGRLKNRLNEFLRGDWEENNAAR